MSDRRPEKLYRCEITPTYDEAYDPPEFFGNVISYPEATVDEVLAYVRSGVESGTIKGERAMWCSTHKCAYNDGAPGCDVWLAAREGGALHPKPCVINQFSEVLVIPVFDGGSET